MSSACGACPLGRAAVPNLCPFQERTLGAGTVLLRQGEVPDGVWYLKRGIVIVSSLSAAGQETSCALRGPGALIGAETLLVRGAAHETWALEDIVACRIPAADFASWLGTDETPTRAVLMLMLTERARLHDERIAVSGTAAARLARFLVAHRRLRGPYASIGMEKRLLARVLGIRAETLSRALATLRSAGALSDGADIIVRDEEILAQQSGDE
jgi:CRP-like cAMP-binding protein